MTARKKVTVVTCAYNEAACIEELSRRLAAVFDSLPAYDFEVLAIENGSDDETPELLRAISKTDNRFRVVELSRNFGLEGGLSAGIALADGNAVVIMASDLEDPPEVIPQFIEQWEKGYENVYGLVRSREGTDWKRRLNSHLFYRLIGRLSEHPIPQRARDFRLMDRKVYQQVRDLQEQRWFLRGIIAWTGFRSTGVEFDQPPRFAGRSKAASLKTMEFATKAIFVHSLTPLRILPVAGFALTGVSFCALIGIVVHSLVYGVPFPGFGTIIALMSLFFGLLFSLLSVIGVYVGLIFEQVRGRPSFVIRSVSPDLDGSVTEDHESGTAEGRPEVGIPAIPVTEHQPNATSAWQSAASK
jgi:dolichol-phosphate mannosyltransferase